MISCCRIQTKIWRFTNSLEGGPSESDKNKMNTLDSEVLRWHKDIPTSLTFDASSEQYRPQQGVSRGQQRLRVILYLRTNQMRTLIYRPVLHSASTIMANRQLSQTGVDVALDTIRVLTRLNETTDIYSTQHVWYDHSRAYPLILCTSTLTFSLASTTS